MADQHHLPTPVAAGLPLLRSTRLPTTPTTTTPTTTTTNNTDPGSSAFYSLYDNSVDSSQTENNNNNNMMSSPHAASMAVLSEFRYPSPPLPLPSTTTAETRHYHRQTTTAILQHELPISSHHHYHHNHKRQKHHQEKREEEEDENRGGEEQDYYYGTLMFDHEEDGSGRHFNHNDIIDIENENDIYYHSSFYPGTANTATTTDAAAVGNAAVDYYDHPHQHRDREENYLYGKHQYQVLESITELTPIITIGAGGALTGGGGRHLVVAPSSVITEPTSSSSLPIGLRLDSSAMEQIIAKMSQS